MTLSSFVADRETEMLAFFDIRGDSVETRATSCIEESSTSLKLPERRRELSSSGETLFSPFKEDRLGPAVMSVFGVLGRLRLVSVKWWKSRQVP